MSSRREFIQSAGVCALAALPAGALAALPPGARAALAADAPDRRPASLFNVVFDQTNADAVGYGAEAANRGAAVQPVGSDIGSAWINVIEPGLQARPSVIAGLTYGAPLFCLELLARDYGLRVVYRVEHLYARGEQVGHVITGGRMAADWSARLAGAGDRWHAVAAEMMTAHADDPQPDAGIALLDLAASPNGESQSLFSWMLAPVTNSNVAAPLRPPTIDRRCPPT
jgi:hypothetical protein